jgi:hypothetical protein
MTETISQDGRSRDLICTTLPGIGCASSDVSITTARKAAAIARGRHLPNVPTVPLMFGPSARPPGSRFKTLLCNRSESAAIWDFGPILLPHAVNCTASVDLSIDGGLSTQPAMPGKMDGHVIPASGLSSESGFRADVAAHHARNRAEARSHQGWTCAGMGPTAGYNQLLQDRYGSTEAHAGVRAPEHRGEEALLCSLVAGRDPCSITGLVSSGFLTPRQTGIQL